MKMWTFIKDNFIRLLIYILFATILLISVFSVEYSSNILQKDGKSINYVGILRGGTQLLVKKELANVQSDELIEQLDSIIYQLKTPNKNNHFTIHEDQALYEYLIILETEWIKLKEEIYNHRAGADSYRLYNLSNDFYELSNNLAFKTQAYAERKVGELASLRTRIYIGFILIVFFSMQQYISKILVQNKNNELNRVAYFDSLTGLSNRAHCNEILLKYNQMKVLPNLACIYIDLNNLKATNDLLGHDAGDKFIIDFSTILKEASSPYGFVCRNGGDEFVAIFENCTQKNIDDYIKYLSEKTAIYNYRESDIKISYAIGVAFSYEISTNKINDVLSLADKRMYENKAEYKKSLLQNV